MACPNEVEPYRATGGHRDWFGAEISALENQSFFWTCTRGSACRPVSAGRARFCFESGCRLQRGLGWDTYEMREVEAKPANRQLRPDEGGAAHRVTTAVGDMASRTRRHHQRPGRTVAARRNRMRTGRGDLPRTCARSVTVSSAVLEGNARLCVRRR